MDLLLAVASESVAEALAAAMPQYNIHICHTGPEAVELLDALRPQGLILDLCLDGLTVLKQAKHQPQAILALTDLMTDEVLRQAARAGIQDVVIKPCTAWYVAERMESLIK